MTADHGPIPDWAKRDREHDLNWIAENFQVFWQFASAAYVKAGRGTILVDTNSHITDKGHPFGYFEQSFIERYDDEDIKRLVRQYDPDGEFVVVLLKPDNHISSYRIQVRPHQ